MVSNIDAADWIAIAGIVVGAMIPVIVPVSIAALKTTYLVGKIVEQLEHLEEQQKRNERRLEILEEGVIKGPYAAVRKKIEIDQETT